MIRFRLASPPYVQPDLDSALSAEFTHDELSAMSRLGTVVDLDVGHVLTSEGDLGREAIIIVSGTAAVSRDDTFVGVVGAGDIVGEMAVLTGERRNASIVATTPLKAAVFTSIEFLTLLDNCPRIDATVKDLVAARQPT